MDESTYVASLFFFFYAHTLTLTLTHIIYQVYIKIVIGVTISLIVFSPLFFPLASSRETKEEEDNQNSGLLSIRYHHLLCYMLLPAGIPKGVSPEVLNERRGSFSSLVPMYRFPT